MIPSKIATLESIRDVQEVKIRGQAMNLKAIGQGLSIHDHIKKSLKLFRSFNNNIHKPILMNMTTFKKRKTLNQGLNLIVIVRLEHSQHLKRKEGKGQRVLPTPKEEYLREVFSKPPNGRRKSSSSLLWYPWPQRKIKEGSLWFLGLRG